jgi:flagellar FliL protein
MSSATSQVEASDSAQVKVGLTAILIPVLLSTILTLGVVGGGVVWLLRSGRLGGGVASGPVSAPTTPVASHVVVLEPMIVNLADGRSYLRAGISLRIRDEAKLEKKEETPKDAKGVDSSAIALRDTTLGVLSSTTADALLTPGGRDLLKKTLEAAYKEHNAETHVMDVYFTEFLVQRG